jgi:hypothetical protein
MSKSLPTNPPIDPRTQDLTSELHRRGRNQLTVKARGPHLVICSQDGEPRARLTRLEGDEFGLSLPSSTGRWESLPFAGSLAAVVADLDENFGFHLDPDPTE